MKTTKLMSDELSAISKDKKTLAVSSNGAKMSFADELKNGMGAEMKEYLNNPPKQNRFKRFIEKLLNVCQ